MPEFYCVYSQRTSQYRIRIIKRKACLYSFCLAQCLWSNRFGRFGRRDENLPNLFEWQAKAGQMYTKCSEALFNSLHLLTPACPALCRIASWYFLVSTPTLLRLHESQNLSFVWDLTECSREMSSFLDLFRCVHVCS